MKTTPDWTKERKNLITGWRYMAKQRPNKTKSDKRKSEFY